MLIAIRLVCTGLGLFTAGLVLAKIVTIEMFIIPDLIVGAFLILSALIPAQRVAIHLMFGANLFALGVFTTAAARFVSLDTALTPALIIALLVAFFSSVSLFCLLHRRIS